MTKIFVKLRAMTTLDIAKDAAEESEKTEIAKSVVMANKLEIRKAVEQMYNVVVESVNTINEKGKLKARYTKAGYLVGRTNAVKKAIVTLKEGDKIDFYSNI